MKQQIDQEIRIVRKPSGESNGTMTLLADLYGHLWDLIESVKKL